MGIGSWLGLVFGLSIPAILLMYLLKRKFIDTLVPSHMLWERVLRNIEANRPWQKLQSRLLLWLQLLAAALLVFALMQPYWWVSADAKGHVVIVADTSGSMSARTTDSSEVNESVDDGYRRMDALKAKVKEYIEEYAQGSEITLLSLESDPNIVISREKDQTRLNEAIDGLEPYYGKSAYRETLSLASALTREEQDAEVVVFTDGEWKGDGEGIPFQVASQVIDIGGTAIYNVSIKQFGVQQGQAGNTAVAVVESTRLNNEPVEYELYGDDKLLRTQTIEWRTDGNTTINLQELEDAEVYRLELQVSDDYEADNVSFAFGSRSTTPRVLYLSSGNLFLERALQLTGAEITKMTIDKSEQAEDSKDMSEPPVPKQAPDLVIIEGIAPAFVQQGEWAKLLGKSPLWTIGGEGQEVKVGGEKAKPLNHPVTKYMTLAGLYFGTVLDQSPPVWGNSIAEIGDKPAIYAGKEGGYARLSFLFKLEDSDLPLSAEFPILINNAVTWLTSGEGSGLGRVIAGSHIDVPISVEAAKAQWVAKAGLALSAGIEPIAADRGSQGFIALQRVPSTPGLYAFEQQGADGYIPRYWVEVTTDPSEGAVDQKTELLLTQGVDVSSDAVVQNHGDGEKGHANGTQVARSLMWILAAAVLTVILLEWGVYQRGHSI
ncbi:vWA domain-containing protein [Paenibacillus sp. IHBB 10380]|uniref:vWA domain-containing protein n=1 Tax=Paenibacillus sp. IHBB 10380 TaxID=1566358 RepID=UPI0005CFB5C7|nr:VWA domain-containing protein [Paenibacillus sp. IHBB 10380]AJS59819.1 hypothetical protein UB51_16525 [Paenibacillus sp. IHBB 10380]